MYSNFREQSASARIAASKELRTSRHAVRRGLNDRCLLVLSILRRSVADPRAAGSKYLTVRRAE
jgi:hypothetical protein